MNKQLGSENYCEMVIFMLCDFENMRLLTCAHLYKIFVRYDLVFSILISDLCRSN